MGAQGERLDATVGGRVAEVAIDLIATGFAERIGYLRPSSGAALVCRAENYINENLGVAGLSQRTVAKAIGVSVRRLHQAASDEGISLTDWMWERRLARARAMLVDYAHSTTPIAVVGYQCGFADQAHFSRRFKGRFGISPTELRMLGTEYACKILS